MTTIAWKGNLLAADTQLTWDEHIRGKSAPKIVRLPSGVILAGAGDNLQSILAEKFFSNPDWDSVPLKDRPKLKKYEAIIVIDRKVYQLETHMVPQLLADPYYAIGSGWKFALAAMAKGDTAPEAVLFASTLDINTNSEIQTVDIYAQTEEEVAPKRRAKKSARTE